MVGTARFELATSRTPSVTKGIGTVCDGELPIAIGLMFLRDSAPPACVRDRYGVGPIVTEVCTKLCTKFSSWDFALEDLEP